MSTDQEQALRILTEALRGIACRGDCEYYDSADRPDPCDCPPCAAAAALDAARNWRFHGALWERSQGEHWPRETKMLAAWRRLATGHGAPDSLLSQILREEDAPSARDWYVATSVIQWLATNVGMTVLEAAGFVYQQHAQDRADAELLRRRQERERDTVGETSP